MKQLFITILTFLLQQNLIFCQVKNDVILVSRAAITLDSVTVHASDNFESKVNAKISKGTILEYIATSNDYKPNTRNIQAYKWYKIKNDKTVLGWVYGENVAIAKNDREINDIYKPYHKSIVKLGFGFEKSLVWFAATDGVDMDEQLTKIPMFDEFCVFTNQYNNNVLIHTSKKNVQGNTKLVKFKIMPILSEKSNEIVVQSTTVSSNNELPIQNLIIYSLENGELNSILDESIDLRLDDYTKSPALCKIVELDGNTIRYAYPDFNTCRNSVTSLCMNYKTNTIIWDKKKRQFKSLYEESETPLTAIITTGTELRIAPITASAFSNFLVKDTKVTVLEENLKYLLINKEKKADIWFKVTLENGTSGFVTSKSIQFIGFEHSTVLNNYYANPPLLRNDWFDSKDFVVILKETNPFSDSK